MKRFFKPKPAKVTPHDVPIKVVDEAIPSLSVSHNARGRRDDDPVELTRMIGYLTATASEDWSIVLEVCERASASDANAKEAVRTLRREFKYSEPKVQLAAARLWAIMLRNASEVFMHHISQRKFIDTLDEVLSSPRTSPVVRERLMQVLAAAAYIASSRAQSMGKDRDRDGFRALWCRLKPFDKPDAGIPFDTENDTFSPPVASLPCSASQYSLEIPIFSRSQSLDDPTPAPASSEHPPVIAEYSLSFIHQPQTHLRPPHHRVIPAEEDIRHLFQECQIARGNAVVLSQALAFAKPDALDTGLIPEFLSKCRASQELIYTQIPWASASAERSRNEKVHTRTRSQDAIITNTENAPSTPEEELLVALLDANEALVGALRMHDDLARVAAERATEEKSKRLVRMDKRQLKDDHVINVDPSAPLPPTTVPSINQPLSRTLPPLPPGLAPTQNQGNHYGSQTNTPMLLTPSHPLGPRSLVQVVTTSSTEDEASDSEEDICAPIRPSAKALGKRRA